MPVKRRLNPLQSLKVWIVGRSLDPSDSRVFHNLSLIALFAWVGLGADGLSSSAYGPAEAFRALGEHSRLGLLVALGSALTVLIISASYSHLIDLVKQFFNAVDMVIFVLENAFQQLLGGIIAHFPGQLNRVVVVRHRVDVVATRSPGDDDRDGHHHHDHSHERERPHPVYSTPKRPPGGKAGPGGRDRWERERVNPPWWEAQIAVTAVIPPSTVRCVPVTNEASELSRFSGLAPLFA